MTNHCGKPLSWLLLGVLALPLAAAPAAAQSWAGRGRLQGSVKDEAGKPVEGATVTVRMGEERVDATAEGPEVMTTDRKGKWSVLGLAGGTWGVLIQKEGFIPSEGQIRVNEFGPVPPINVTLKKPSEEMIRAQEEAAAQAAAQTAVGQAKAAIERGNAALLAEDYPAARAAYEEGLAKLEDTKHHPGILRGIASTYFKEEKVDEAVKALQRALAIDPEDHETLKLLANILVAAGREAEAEPYMAKLPQGSVDPNSLLNIGIKHYNAGELDQALAQFQKVVEQYPELPEAYYYRGLVYLNQGKNAQAKADFEKLLAMAPDHRHAADAQEFLKAM